MSSCRGALWPFWGFLVFGMIFIGASNDTYLKTCCITAHVAPTHQHPISLRSPETSDTSREHIPEDMLYHCPRYTNSPTPRLQIPHVNNSIHIFIVFSSQSSAVLRSNGDFYFSCSLYRASYLTNLITIFIIINAIIIISVISIIKKISVLK